MTRVRFRKLVRNFLVILAAAIAAHPAWSATWIVSGASPSCSDAGPGSDSVPFCTIGRGASRAVPGDTVLVNPATYREQVTAPVSGAPGASITYRALVPGVIVLGTFDVSDPSGWTATPTNAWSRPYAPPSNPGQVFLDGTRLAAATSATTTTTDSFFYDGIARVLYVDIGGANPGVGHGIEAGARQHGFRVDGRTDIVIDGFEIRNPNNVGVSLGACSAITVRRSTISSPGSFGIDVDGSVGPILIEGNDVSFSATDGIRLQSSSGATVRGNASHHNIGHGIGARSTVGSQLLENRVYFNRDPIVRRSSGLDINVGSSDNLILGNAAYGNDDSGIQVYGGSHRNVLARNTSFGNGDHGFDVNASEDVRCVSNTACGNLDSGFNFENGAVNARCMNNIAADNGLGTATFNLLVGSSAIPGFLSDRNLFWKSAPGDQVRYGGTNYASVALFATQTGNEVHGLEADPVFRNAASGDLRVLAQSPAVDSADASVPGFTPEDHDGFPPQDIIVVADTGAGVPTFADRGAYEYHDLGPGEPGLESPLTLAKSGDDLILSWGVPSSTCLPADFAVYRGSLESLQGGVYDHDTVLTCAAGGASLGIGIADPRLGTADYFLVVATDGGEEGSYGRDSLQIERPVSSAAACAVAQDLTTCVP